MIYPNNYESKIGFDTIRHLLKEHCMSSLGKEKVDELSFSDDAALVNEQMAQIREMRRLMEAVEKPEMNYFFDVRESVTRIRMENTHLEEDELFDLRRSLETIGVIVTFLNKNNGDDEFPEYTYPALHRLAADVQTFPAIIRRIDSILDKFGKIKDSASMTLAGIRHEMEQTAGSISRTLYTILHSAQRDGLVAQDVAPTLRDGRLMIPVAPGLKRRIKGIVHDESATGKTVFIEPAEVVEANNKVRELEAQERREIIRILTVFSDELRPHVQEVLDSYHFLAQIDLIHAKAEMAIQMQAFEPEVKAEPTMDWIRAIHPLLQRSLQKQDKKVVPLDIILVASPQPSPKGEGAKATESPSLQGGARGRLLIISGPNAGGKSVCLKTVGLLQYMVQCGLSIPIGDRSTVGLFQSIMIDIGDEQSIADDLSTYSSHLLNMKNMMKQANAHTLLLIDEFGGGTEPTIGGAIAEAVLKQFWKKQAFGVITTHYQNLKHFAEDHPGVVNGAMLYDRHQMQALFQLSIGQPGSSFAIEIARKTGIPEEVISDASEIVGSDYIQSDKYLQDIVRDKRYWEGKRQQIHQQEKQMEQTTARYEEEIARLKESRRQILSKAKEEAEELLRETNRKIENTIREIRESQAERESTRKLREDLNQFKQEVLEIDTKADEELVSRKIRQIQERQQRRDRRRKEKAERQAAEAAQKAQKVQKAEEEKVLKVGDSVRIKGLSTVGTIEKTDGKTATVVFGDMRTKMRADRLEHADKPALEDRPTVTVNRTTRETIDHRREQFHQDIDVRGMRGDEALNAVTYFIDDAILVGVSRVRILHGTGTGILRQLIRQYLSTVPAVTNYRDEHVQFGGAGITVVDLE